jgi:hypothetical protein
VNTAVRRAEWYGLGTWVTNQLGDIGNTFRARSTSERRDDQCPGSNRYRWIKKLNLSPNISVQPFHLLNYATDTASVAKPATNGSIAIRQKARPVWPSDLADHIHLRTKRLSLSGSRSLRHAAVIPVGSQEIAQAPKKQRPQS